MYKAFIVLNEKNRILLYYSLLFPYLYYCSEIWVLCGKLLANNIFISQKKTIRIICSIHYLDHTSSHFKRLKIMKFSDLVDIKVAIILYKAFHGILPYSIQSLFKLNVNNTRQYNKFVVKYTRTSLKAKCISSYGVRYWNKLSSEIQISLV